METVCVPTDLTAFVLNDKTCDGASRLAPITQPNYMGLQLNNSLVQHDVLDHIDFHLSAPTERNQRVTDLGAEKPEFALRKNRLGVYLHWSLPRLYRTASSTAKAPGPGDKADSSQPVFRKVPNRWLVVRHLDLKTADPPGKLPEYQSWIIESDKVRTIEQIDRDTPPNAPPADLEVDCVPFVSAGGDVTGDTVLNRQVEVFLGKKTDHLDWTPGQSKGQTGWAEGDAQAPGLTVMDSSNPLFPDYVPHNSNVFSLIDSFKYKDGNDFQYLGRANADYFVVGWHTNVKDSPLFSADASITSMLSQRLSTLMLDTRGLDKNILQTQDAFNMLVHGAMYKVAYEASPATKIPSVSDDAAIKFTKDVKMEPLSMGTTALDGILTFLEAHNSKHANDEESIFGSGSSAIAEDVLNLATLLYAADDSYNERIKAQDLLYTNNYAKDAGGFEWHFSGNAGETDSKAAAGQARLPTDDEKEKLNQLNELQSQYDALAPNLQSMRWNLFSLWWKFVSDPNWNNAEKWQPYKDRVGPLKQKIIAFDARIAGLGHQITEKSANVPFKKSSKPTFFIRKDPTLCIAGLDSGWPADFMDKMVVKLDSQITPSDKSMQGAAAFFGQSKPIVSDETQLAVPARKLFADFLDHLGTPIDGTSRAHKTWGGASGNKNPFQPLFIEWEAQYYHVERKKWAVGVRPSPVGHPHSQVRYTIKEELSDQDQKDVRTISGRVLLTPQPSFSLEAIVKQVLDNGTPKPEPPPVPATGTTTPPAPTQDSQASNMLPLTAKQIQEVKDGIRKLQFISAPLSGLTEHLLTRYEGSHVKPNFRAQGQTLRAMREAVIKCEKIDVSVDRTENGQTTQPSMVELIGPESALTPYANLLSFEKAAYPGVPFKAVTHGQMLFTKLNIIDKFGQAICVVEPKPRPKIQQPPPPSFYPCMSDFLSPDFQKNGTKLNTVYDETISDSGKWPTSRFMQLTPSINQNARINATFLNASKDGKAPFWHETNDDMHESPVFGWLVLNYQDNGLQFFLPDGTFYREVRVGGPTGTNAGSKWLPFDPPQADKNTGNQQLDQLIERVTTHKNKDDDTDTPRRYLQGIFDMINGAIKNMPYPPSDYAAFANAIVGKPLALVNIGWSLELQSPPLTYQNTLGNHPPDGPTDIPDLLTYKFPLKIGDADRPFDGTVGYYLTDNTPTSNTTQWERLFTYFPSANTPHTVNLTASEFFSLSPYYNTPPLTSPSDPKATPFVQARTDSYTITTAIIDPYTPIHAFSPSLPIKSLRLQPWTLQQAFSRMTAFFRLGPYLLSHDIPPYVDTPLEPDSWNTTKGPKDPSAVSTTGKTAAAPIRLPISGRKGLWQWLQPYDLLGEKEGDDRRTRFNAMDVGEEDTIIRAEAAPYTFVEGYLQLARPLLKEDVKV